MASEHTAIQAAVDRLADALVRPTSIDDPDFRLLFHSPQHGPVDHVRVRSILDRDSPTDAKEWVRAQGVLDAVGVHRLDGAPHVGMYPRIYAPIRHDGQLLGFLWVIDPDASLPSESDAAVARAADEIAPLLYSRSARDLLDRHHRREAVLGLLDESAVARDAAAGRLESSGTLAAGTPVTALVVDVLVPRGAGWSATDSVALEMALERVRARTTGVDLVHAAEGDAAVVVLAERPGAAGVAPRSVAAAVHREVDRALPPHRTVVGIGTSRPSLRDVRESHADATVVTRALRLVPELGDLAHHDDLAVHGLVARLPPEALSQELVPVPLRRLLDAADDDLLTTLAVFLDEAGDVAATAARLHLHRSSVYGRLRRIEDLVGRSLGDGGTRLELHLGLVVARFLGLLPPATTA